ncbi:MAG: type II secretion system F family protein [Myxococcota bacterium]
MDLFGAIAGGSLLAAAGVSSLELWRRAQVRRRLFEDDASEEIEPTLLEDRSRLGTWLVRAGYRDRSAPLTFIAALATSLVAAVGTILLALQSPVVPALANQLLALPVVGGGAATVIGLLPWFLGIALAAAPILWVRRQRRERVASVERDLPLALEILATLAEAGSGFDSSIAQLLDAQASDRPLPQELRVYQLEMQTGAGRARCLERLSDRVGVTQMTDLVRSLTHAEETGSGIAGILRPQAEDLRQQQRERALARAEALPEKLVLPLLVGFLPGLMVWTLGPAFHQLFGMLDAALG